ncbi:hypothetical protein TNCV_4173171 [Trichonephila clavipes]|nr:hypothetical protein TNCV_4173171 [Trichonephila clavipes]
MHSAFLALGFLNSQIVTSPFVRLVEGEERWKAPGRPHCVLPQNLGETEPNLLLSPEWCSKLRITTGVDYMPLETMTFVGLHLTPSDR